MISKAEWTNALIKRHGKDFHCKISETTVAVCGLGGLGSNIAALLARAGIKKLILIDFDKVDITNLHRQQYESAQIGMHKTDAIKENLAKINPFIETETHSVFLEERNMEELLRDADIVCEAFDNAESKAMLVNFVLQHMPDKYIIAASGMAGIGSCNTIITRRISNKFYLCGDGVSEVSEDEPLISSRVMLCAAHQAHTALRIIAGNFEV